MDIAHKTQLQKSTVKKSLPLESLKEEKKQRRRQNGGVTDPSKHRLVL